MIGGPVAVDQAFPILVQNGKIAGDDDEEAFCTFRTGAIIRSSRIDTTANDEARHSFARLGLQNMDG